MCSKINLETETFQKWIAALRSGNYKQGKFLLRSSTDNFCCLGVLCDIMDSSKWDIANINKLNNFSANTQILDNTKWEKPLGHYAYNGEMHQIDFRIIPPDVQKQLMDMNDRNIPFEKIANWIDQNIEITE